MAVISGDWSSDAEGQDFPSDHAPQAKRPRVKDVAQTATCEEDEDDPKTRDCIVMQPRDRNCKVSKARKQTIRARLMAEFMSCLPLDIVFTIFSMLEPLDLLRLAQSTKTLRRALMSKTSRGVWRAARANVQYGVPDCPPDQSEPQWANLLFTCTCMICDTAKVLNVDWAFRLRVCDTCLKANVVVKSRAAKMFPNIKNMDQVLDLLPYSNRNTYRGRYYSRHGIEQMAAAIDDWEGRVAAKEFGASDAYEAFKAAAHAQAAKITNSSQEYRNWTEKRKRSKVEDERNKKAARKEGLIMRLLETGHERRDIDRVAWHPFFSSAAELTDARWKQIKEELLGRVCTAKEDRLDEARGWLVQRRRTVAKEVYSKYKQDASLPPFSLLPLVDDIVGFEAFKEIIRQDGERDLKPDDFADAVTQLPSIIEAWRSPMIAKLFRVIKAGGGLGASNPPSVFDMQRLGLAKNFFTCKNAHRRVEDFEHLGVHYHCSGNYWRRIKTGAWDLSCLRYSQSASDEIERVLKTAGLDPDTTTAAQMDAMDLRFFCQACPEGDNIARTWRNCAVHKSDHVITGWTVLTPEEIAEAKELETSLLLNNYDSRFRCPSCPTDGPFGTSDLGYHFKRWHGKTRPEPGEYAEDPAYTRHPVVLGRNPAQQSGDDGSDDRSER